MRPTASPSRWKIWPRKTRYRWGGEATAAERCGHRAIAIWKRGGAL